MMPTHIAGFGKKRPQIDVPIERLHLDSENPRLPDEAKGKGDPELLNILYKKFYLDEVAESMAKNGYFDEEPLVAVPRKLPKALVKEDSNPGKFQEFINKATTEFIVVEGNRRLATAKLLLDSQARETQKIRHWPTLSKEVKEDLGKLPIIVYRKRSDVTPYLGVRHIVGIQRWDSYPKARYIAKLIESGYSIEEVKNQIGDKQGAVVKNYLCFQLLEQAKNEYELDLTKAIEDFSLLILAIGQGKIKRFLGLPSKSVDLNLKEPVPRDRLNNLKELLTWIFGDGRTKPIITDSRDITDYLTHVVSSDESLKYLRKTSDLTGAYDRSDGEESLLLKYLTTANSKLEGALGIAHRHRTQEVIDEVEKCAKTIKTLLNNVKEQEDV